MMPLPQRPHLLLAALWLPCGCSDYRLHGKQEDNRGASGSGGDRDGEMGADEDSGEGGEDGSDGDGHAGSDTCEAETAEAGTVPLDDSCETGDPWDVELAWQWQHLGGGSSTQQAATTPVVGRFVDQNGDGTITDADPPVVAVVVYGEATLWRGELVVLDGQTGTELWSRAGLRGMSGLLMADIDANGRLELVGIDENGFAVAFDGSGRTLWRASTAVTDWLPSTQLAVTDLDGDGMPELLVHELVLDGQTGAVELDGLGPTHLEYVHWAPLAADLDGDGSQEILHGDRVYDALGNLLWTHAMGSTTHAWPVVTDVDGDSEGEVIYIGNEEMVARDPDGTEVMRTPLPTTVTGPPCLADFDGDGRSELALVSDNSLYQIELDGTVSWTAPVFEYSGYTGCIGVDLDRDGAHDVVLADMDAVRILDGRTGALRYEDPDHSSFTQLEIPAVADVDGDGVTEIVTVANDYVMPGRTGLTVYRSTDGVWPETWPLWPGHSFNVTHFAADGSVPASPTPSWLADDLLRAWPLETSESTTNLWPTIVDVCVQGCGPGGSLELTATVSNSSATDAPGPVELAVYRELDGELTLLDLQIIADGVAAGTSTASLRFELAADELTGAALVLVVDPDDAIEECDEDDNMVYWPEVVCP